MAKRKTPKQTQTTSRRRQPGNHAVLSRYHTQARPDVMSPGSYEIQVTNSEPACPAAVTRGRLFAALLPEIRDMIFTLLLVQPVKWDMLHHDVCPRRTKNINVKPIKSGESLCSNCDRPTVGKWRKSPHSIAPWVSPWRSQWAPEPTSPYLCSDCYDAHVRPGPFPRPLTLPCLCARRTNLQILLVSRQWYLEAARVFYTQNTFAFEDSSTFIHFIDNLSPPWRAKLTKISLMALITFPPPEAQNRGWLRQRRISPNRTWPHGATATLHDLPITLEQSPSKPLWRRLPLLPNLTHLEIDALYLTRPDTLTRILRHAGSARHLRSVKFVTRVLPLPSDTGKDADAGTGTGTAEIWPTLSSRREMSEDPFTQGVARAVLVGGRRWRRPGTAFIKEGTAALRGRLGLEFLEQ